MRSMNFMLCCLFLLACGPEDNPEDCSLESVEGRPFSGFVRLCNAIPGQQQDFPGKAVFIINDTLLSFNIKSKDPNFSFEHDVTVYAKCELAESEFIHILYDTMNNEVLGSIGLNKTSISIQLTTSPCLDNGSFSGVLK